jgi:hypothetical protein
MANAAMDPASVVDAVGDLAAAIRRPANVMGNGLADVVYAIRGEIFWYPEVEERARSEPARSANRLRLCA